MKRFFLMLAACSFYVLAFGQQKDKQKTLNLMPVPQKVEIGEGKFRLHSNLMMGINPKAHQRVYRGASRFLRRLAGRTGLDFSQEWIMKEDYLKNVQIKIQAREHVKVKLDMDESYAIRVKESGIRLEAQTDIGALRGLETLLQLLSVDDNGYFFPEVNIEDKPRFPWRGLLIDVSRHFQSVEVIKRNLDALAAVKMNVLHLHLTDDHGFRVESKTYPQLTELASERQYFTHEQIKEIIKYADERGIRVIPEFGMPSHGTSWLVAFPELASAPGPYQLQKHAGIFDPTIDPTNEKSYEVLGNFLKEMSALFPDEYIHIGGDENEGHHWDENPKIQEFMQVNGMKDNHDLQAYFNNRILKIFTGLNKK